MNSNSKNNTAAKHTPGPWKLHNPAVDELAVQSADFSIAEWPTNYTPEELANANLIAAAPELLEALTLMRDHYDDLRKSNPGFMGKLTLKDYSLWNRALVAMENALTKVKGGGK